MSKKKDEIIEEVEEVEEAESKEVKGKDAIEKRKRRKKIDTVERWSGIIFMFLVLLVGLLLLVGSEISDPNYGKDEVLSPIDSSVMWE